MATPIFGPIGTAASFGIASPEWALDAHPGIFDGTPGYYPDQVHARFEEVAEALGSFYSSARPRGARISGLACLLGWLSSPEVVRAVARQRVDATIAAYRAPFARAVAAGLRAACEYADLLPRDIDHALQMFVWYEQHRGIGAKASPIAKTALSAWMQPPIWAEQALDVYERERAR